MPLTEAKCTNCGANLQVDPAREAAVCQYCGAAFVIEKAINNYKITNEIHDSVVNIYSGDYQSANDFFEKGNALAQIGDFSAAAKVFALMNEKYPGDWRGWWGRVLCGTKSGKQYPPELSVPFWYKSARKLAPEHDFAPVAEWYEQYCRFCAHNYIDYEVAAIRARQKRSFSEIIRIETSISALREFRLLKIYDWFKQIEGIPIVLFSLYFFGYAGIYQTLTRGGLNAEAVFILLLCFIFGLASIVSGINGLTGKTANRGIADFSVLTSQIALAKADILAIREEIAREEQILRGGSVPIEKELYDSMVLEIS